MKIPTGLPYSETRLIKYLEKRILELRPRKTQTAIAAEADFRQPNMLAMVKRGSTKLPLDRVPGLAGALKADAAYLFRLALEQMNESTTSLAIDRIFRAVITENEGLWIQIIRDASGNADPHPTAKAVKAIRAIFGR